MCNFSNRYVCVVYLCVYVEHYFFLMGDMFLNNFFLRQSTRWAGVAETEVNRVCFVSFPAS